MQITIITAAQVIKKIVVFDNQGNRLKAILKTRKATSEYDQTLETTDRLLTLILPPWKMGCPFSTGNY